MHEMLFYGPVLPHAARAYTDTGVTDREFAEFLMRAGGQPVKIRLNSGGGDADAGFAMMASIQQYKGDVEIHIDGMAASAATLFLTAKSQGNTQIHMASNAGAMLHKSLVLIMNYMNADELRRIADQNDTYDTRLAAAYAAKSGGDQKEWLDRITGDNYYTSGDLKDLGLVDRVTGEVEVRMDQPLKTIDSASGVQASKGVEGVEGASGPVGVTGKTKDSVMEDLNNGVITAHEATSYIKDITASIYPDLGEAPDWMKDRLNAFQDKKLPADLDQKDSVMEALTSFSDIK